ncbi:MAG: Coenzyme F420 hydrogenase/dehydrogenase, beta subunit C-terminal domain [Anaerostipes sp.]|jgi:coenzyme F420-reducing hydrogenase beta subunit
MFEEYKNHDIAVYAGYLKDDTKLMQSASGGVATALASYVLEQGGYVVGVAYTPDLQNAEYIIIHDQSELYKLKGSKYIDTQKGTIYKDVKQLLSEGELVLFTGTPCTVAALHKMVGRPENLISCELICHGPTLPKVHQDFIATLERKEKSKIIDFSVRHKKHEWQPSYICAKFKNGAIYEKPLFETDYGYAFMMLGKEGCYKCQFRGDNRTGDIMVGDFWGATENDEFWNKRGVSVIFAETERGNELVKKIEDFQLFESDFERAVEQNPMIIRPKDKEVKTDLFKQLLFEKGLHYATIHTYSKKKRIKYFLEKILPSGVISAVKKIKK